MGSRITELKFDDGARAIGTKFNGSDSYLVSTTKSNAIVKFFGKFLRGPLERKGEIIKLNEGEHALIVKHSQSIVNYYVYRELPLLEAKEIEAKLAIQ